MNSYFSVSEKLGRSFSGSLRATPEELCITNIRPPLTRKLDMTREWESFELQSNVYFSALRLHIAHTQYLKFWFMHMKIRKPQAHTLVFSNHVFQKSVLCIFFLIVISTALLPDCQGECGPFSTVDQSWDRCSPSWTSQKNMAWLRHL